MEWYFDNQVVEEEDQHQLVVPQDYEFTFNNGSDTSFDMLSSKYNNKNGLWNDQQPDFQQFSEEINHMDDLFFNSLFEEDPTDDNIANIFEAEILHSQNGGTLKYLKTHDDAFSPSTDWGNTELSTTYQTLKQYTSNEKQTEESILNDLERVTAKFTDKTRICFRDAFYRFAKSSKQSLNSCLEGDPMMTSSNDDTSRGQETEFGESETNVIDRAVGNLMLQSKFDFEENNDDQRTYCQDQRDYNDDAIVPQWGMQDKFVISIPC